MSYWLPARAARSAESRARSPADRARARCRPPAPSRRAFGTITASRSCREHVEQSVRVGRHDGLPHRERLEDGQRRALPQRREHAEVERGEHARDVAREAARTRSDRPVRARRACASRSVAQRSFADEEEPRRSAASLQHQLRGLDQVRVAFRVVQPRDRADRELVGARCRAPAGPPQSPRASAAAELLERHARDTPPSPCSAGICRAWMTKSAVLFDTAIAMSVTGSSSRSAIFWNHGVSVRFACSCRIVGRPRIAPASRPNVVAP